MNRLALAAVLALTIAAPVAASAQAPVTAAPDQLALLKSRDPKLAANKKLVFDMWREVLEAGHGDLAEKYLREDYIQHNPLVATGRAAFLQFLSRRQPQPIKPTITAKLVNITAEGDYVTLAFVRELAEPADPAKKYTSTWFDMFRIQDGKIAEHWDTATKPTAPPPAPAAR
jgi:predicted SnoaL-like aldol condensation-catalyzing enzyme